MKTKIIRRSFFFLTKIKIYLVPEDTCEGQNKTWKYEINMTRDQIEMPEDDERYAIYLPTHRIRYLKKQTMAIIAKWMPLLATLSFTVSLTRWSHTVTAFAYDRDQLFHNVNISHNKYLL